MEPVTKGTGKGSAPPLPSPAVKGKGKGYAPNISGPSLSSFKGKGKGPPLPPKDQLRGPQSHQPTLCRSAAPAPPISITFMFMDGSCVEIEAPVSDSVRLLKERLA